MSKNIALFIDGTWNNAALTQQTNVHKLYLAAHAVSEPSILDDDGIPVAPPNARQVVHYLNGVGTGGYLDTCVGGATGFGTSEKIKEAYLFIAMNYQRGDNVYLFGFSRGAFAARSLAAFVAVVGWTLKDKPSWNKVDAAYVMYVQAGGRARIDQALMDDLEISRGQLVESRPIPIRLIGVWDTVKMTVHPDSPKLPNHITNARHALALHDLRPEFEPTLWEDWDQNKQSLEQVWFPGAHSNVGGGYANTDLSDAALLWMACESNNLGLDLHLTKLQVLKTLPGAVYEEKRMGYPLKPRAILSNWSSNAHRRMIESFFIHKTTCAQLLNTSTGQYWKDCLKVIDKLKNNPENRKLVSRQNDTYSHLLTEVDDLALKLYLTLSFKYGKHPVQ